MKVCCRCKESKKASEFNQFARNVDGLQPHCRDCSKAYYQANRTRHIQNARRNTQVAREAGRKLVRGYLLSHPCVDCGESDLLVLDFDHVRGKKIKAVSHLVHRGYSLKRISQEIAKCEVRCANCHRRITSQRRIAAIA